MDPIQSIIFVLEKMRALFIIAALAGSRPWVRGADDQYINWEDSTIVQLINSVFSDANVDNPCSAVGGPDTINAIVDAVTVNGTVHIPLAFTTTFLEDTINVTGVTLSGLDTFTEVNLFDATNEYYLNNHLALAAPAATIHARALQKKVIGSDNYEEFTLAMNMNALTLDAQIYALVSSAALGALHLDQASSLGCLQSTVDALNVTEFNHTTESWSCHCVSTPAQGSKDFICSGIGDKLGCSYESAPPHPAGLASSKQEMRHGVDSVPQEEGEDASRGGGAYISAAAATDEKKHELVSLLLNAIVSGSPGDTSSSSHPSLVTSEQPLLDWFPSALVLGAEMLAASLDDAAAGSASVDTLGLNRRLPPVPPHAPLPSSPCPAHVPNLYGTPPASYLNFTAQNTLFAAMSSALSQVSPASVNAMIDCLTTNTSSSTSGQGGGVVEVEGNIGAPLNLSAHLGVEVQLHDLRLAGLSSFDVLSLLVPTSALTLASHVGLRHLALTVGLSVVEEEEVPAAPPPSSSRRLSALEALPDPFRALFTSAETTATSAATAEAVGASYSLSLNVSRLNVHAGSLVKLDLSKLSDLTLSQVTSPGCVLSAFDQLKMTELSLLATSAMLEMVPLATTPAPTMPSAVASSISTSMESRVLFAPSLPDWKKSGFSLDLAPLLDKLFNGTNRGGIGAGVLVNNMVLKPRLDAANATCYNTTEAPAPIVVPPTFDDDAPDQAAAEVLEAYMTAASLGALAFVVVISCVATAKSRERRAADRRRKMAEGAGQEMTPSVDGVPSTRFSHFTSSSSSFLANQRLPPHRSSSQSGHPVNTPLLANDDDVSAEQWHDDGVVTSNGGTREGSARGYAGANYAVVSGSKGDVSGDNMTKRAQQRARLVSFGGSDDEDDEASELVAFMNDEDVNRLWDSPKFSANVRWGIPIGCVACAALLVSANLGLGAAVFAQIELGDRQAIDTPSFFDFTLQSSVQDMWDAGVYPLSVLIALLSGGWPYLKLLLIGVCWVCPLQVRRRETILQWLDALGKWSLLDSYVMVAMMVAFNFKIYLGPDQSGLPGGEAIRVTIFTVPGYGFYTFMFGTMISLVLGHAATFFHRFAASPVSRIPAGGDREALCKHAFRPITSTPGHHGGAGPSSSSLARSGQVSSEVVSHLHSEASHETSATAYEEAGGFQDGDEDNSEVAQGSAPTTEAGQHQGSSQEEEEEGVQLSSLKRWGVAFLIVATFGVLIAGAVLRSYRFTFGGLVGWMLDSSLVGVGSSPRQQSYSLLSTYKVLPSAAPVPDDLSLHFIQNAFLGYALVMPLMHLVLLLYAWLVPTTLRTQAFLLVIGEVANAWSAVDVFIFSLFAALLQIGQFCAFIVAAPCGSPVEAFGGASLNDMIGSFFEKHNIDEEASCLTVSASLIQGCFALLVAGVSVFLTSQLVLGYAHSAVHDRLNDLLEANKKQVQATEPKILTTPQANSSLLGSSIPFSTGARSNEGGVIAEDYEKNAAAPEIRPDPAPESTFTAPHHNKPRRTGL